MQLLLGLPKGKSPKTMSERGYVCRFSVVSSNPFLVPVLGHFLCSYFKKLLDPTSRNCRLILERISPLFPTFLTRYSLQSSTKRGIEPMQWAGEEKKTNEEEEEEEPNASEN